jgi:hypothetical protein
MLRAAARQLSAFSQPLFISTHALARHTPWQPRVLTCHQAAVATHAAALAELHGVSNPTPCCSGCTSCDAQLSYSCDPSQLSSLVATTK